MCPFLKILVGVSFFEIVHVSSTLTVVQGTKYAAMETVNLRYMGPQRRTIEGPAVFVHGPDLCFPRAAVVAGRVCVTDRIGSFCDLQIIYDRLESAGALALVLLTPYKVPGTFTFRHDTWDPYERRHFDMTIVDVYSGNVELSAWRASSDLILKIAPPHNMAYFNLAQSWQVIFFMRVLIPMAAFWSSYISFKVFFKLWQRSITASTARADRILSSKIICIIEGIANTIIGFLLATGYFGKMVLPNTLYYFYFTMLQGTYLAATVILTLAIRAEKAGQRSLPLWRRDNIWFLALILLISSDVVFGVFIATAYDEAVGTSVFLEILMVFYTLVDALIGAYYLVQAYFLAGPLFEYFRLRHVMGVSRGPQAFAILRLAFILVLNSFFIVLSTISVIALSIAVLNELPSPEGFIFTLGCIMLSRVGGSYWHVIAVNPKSPHEPPIEEGRTLMDFTLVFIVKSYISYAIPKSSVAPAPLPVQSRQQLQPDPFHMQPPSTQGEEPMSRGTSFAQSDSPQVRFPLENSIDDAAITAFGFGIGVPTMLSEEDSFDLVAVDVKSQPMS